MDIEKNDFWGHKCLGAHIAQNSTGVNTEHQNTCPKKNYYFLCKIHHIYVYQIIATTIKLFFIFLFHNTLTAKLFGQKSYFSKLEIFIDKASFNCHLFNKINVTTLYVTTIFRPFYLNP